MKNDQAIKPLKWHGPGTPSWVYSNPHFPAIQNQSHWKTRREVLGDDSVRLRHEDVDRRLPAPGEVTISPLGRGWSPAKPDVCFVWNWEGGVHAEHSTWVVKLCESALIYLLSNCISRIIWSVRQFQKQSEDGSDPAFVQFQNLSTNHWINSCTTRYF